MGYITSDEYYYLIYGLHLVMERKRKDIRALLAIKGSYSEISNELIKQSENEIDEITSLIDKVKKCIRR